MATHITPVILAGGSGSRLWPISRPSLPKQFIDISSDGRSTFQGTLERISGHMFARPIIVTNKECRETATEQMHSMHVDGDVIVEPEQCGTALAVAIASHVVKARNEGSLCLVLASDHIVQDVDRFEADCRVAAQLASQQHIAIFGIVPRYANTEYGYIEPGDIVLDKASNVRRFIEKPALSDAEALLKQGCLWNSGNLMFDPETLSGELEVIAPKIASAAGLAVKDAMHGEDTLTLPDNCGRALGSISIDYALLEKTERAAVVHASFDWADIGSWQSVYNISSKDEHGNVLKGEVHTLDTFDSLVFSDGPTAAAIGLRDIALIVTSDAVLVTDKSQASRAKELVYQLPDRKPRNNAQRVHRPWGWYERLGGGPDFQVKQLWVRPQAALSLQMHHHRTEHWTIVQGVAEVTTGKRTGLFKAGSNVYIPKECIHRLRNAGQTELMVIEVQTGSYLGEDDIVRFEDLYDRV